MFALTAAAIFFVAIVLSGATIVWMFSSYRDKIIAAVLYHPIPKDEPAYRMMEVRRVTRS